jgi:TM2 domain-containing membrane protein YozV
MASIAPLAALAAALLTAEGARAQPHPPPPRTDPSFVELLLELGLAPEAGREARRLMLQEGAEALPPAVAFRLGMALALDGRAAEAVPFLTQAAAESDNPGTADSWQLAAGVVLLRGRAFPHALQVFARVEAFGADAATRSRATRLRCIGQVLARDGTAARACIASLAASSAPPPAAIVDPLIEDLEIDPGARGVVGGVLSALVPGLGQLTAGHPGDAGLALLVNGAWAVAFYLLIVDAAYLEAGLVALGFGLRYYIGNVRNGAAAWRVASEERRARASERLMRVLGQGNAAAAASSSAPVPARHP